MPSSRSTQWLLLASLLALSFLASTQAADPSRALTTKLRAREFDTALTQYDAQNGLTSRRLVTQATASAQANEVGAKVRKAIKQLRGGSDTFYNEVITAGKIYLCEKNATNKVRFVSKSNKNAYLYDNGTCVLLPISALSGDDVVNAYKQGQCEVKPNCYWGPIEPGDTTRLTIYAEADSTMDKKGADAKIKDWLTGIAGFAIPGVILSVLSLLTMIFFLICRCCCNRCGGRSPREDGYTCMQKFLPILFFLLFAVGVVAVSAVALLYRDTMLTAVDDMFNATSDTLTNASGWIVDLRTPMEKIRDKVVTSADLVSVELNGTDFIEGGVDGMVTELRTFGGYSANRMIPENCVIDTDNTTNPDDEDIDADGRVCLPCIVCQTISSEVATASDQIETNAAPGVEQLGTVKKQLNDQLVGISTSVRDSVNAQVVTANSTISKVDDFQSQVDDYNSKFQSYRDMVGYAIMAFFALAIAVIGLGFIGILLGLTPLKVLANILHIAYFIGFIALFLTFIVSAVALALGVVLGDACEVTLILSGNWTLALGDSADMVNACFQNESLIDALNLSSKLEFARGGIDFPSIDVSSMLDFSELDTFSNTILATNESTFPFNETKFDDAIVVFNSYATQVTQNCNPSDSYTAENLLQPWEDTGVARVGDESAVEYVTARFVPYNTSCDGTGQHNGVPNDNKGKPFVCSSGTCAFSDFMTELFGGLYDMASVKNGVTVFVDELHHNITGVTNYTDAFKENTTRMNDGVNDIKSDLQSSLISYVDDFENTMYCTFIADGFWNIYKALCGDLMPALTMIALMLFLAGIFLIPVNICLIIAVKRLKAHGNGHIMDTEMKFK
ncbi:hypothetical protein BBJ28_00015753 [Nothophytophthora sp. Chile5]|nr:hypothetical protein BBJ28_00015753 [Nothophytophthora sp. Chile5]